MPKYVVDHPSRDGFVKSLGEPHGQIADYRKSYGKEGLHVREYKDRYTIHWDKTDPLSNPMGHLLEDAPHWLAVAGGIALAVLAGLFLGRRKGRLS